MAAALLILFALIVVGIAAYAVLQYGGGTITVTGGGGIRDSAVPGSSSTSTPEFMLGRLGD